MRLLAHSTIAAQRQNRRLLAGAEAVEAQRQRFTRSWQSRCKDLSLHGMSGSVLVPGAPSSKERM
jgi:hypothetical protein